MKNLKNIYSLILLGLMFLITITNVHATTFKQIINADVGHYPPSSISVVYEDVEIVGSYAYVSDANLAGLRVVSLSDPANPSLVASRAVTKANCYEIEIANNIAYLRTMESQDYDIEFIDISNPLSLTYKDLLNLNNARGFDAYGTNLFVNNGTFVISYNFTDIDNPMELDRLNLTESGQSLTLFGDYIFTCTSTYQLKIINATDPSDLVLVSSTDLGDFYAESYLLNGNILFISGLDGTKSVLPERVHRAYVKAIDISNKLTPSILSEIFIDGINGVGLSLHGNNLFIGACAEGIKIVDISTPSSLQAIGYYDDYQEIYCTGEHYALNPKFYNDATYGNLLIFVSMACGLNIISIDSFEYEFTIPGFEISSLVFTAMVVTVLLYRKLRNNIISS